MIRVHYVAYNSTNCMPPDGGTEPDIIEFEKAKEWTSTEKDGLIVSHDGVWDGQFRHWIAVERVDE